MDGFFEKFSIFDFFNLLAAGAIFLLGLIAIFAPELGELSCINIVIDTISKTEWFLGASILGVCYLIGTLFQQVSSLTFERKYSHRITSRILCNQNSVMNNPIKLQVHQEYARQLFEKKKISYTGNCFSEVYCEYYFAYCSYYIQNQNKSHKTEKMRGLRGIYSLLVTCFTMLLFISLIWIALSVVCGFAVLYRIIVAIVFIVLILIYSHAYRVTTQYWVRMVLGVFETCIDIDLHIAK